MQKDPLNWKANRLMKSLGVDDAAHEAYLLEKISGCKRVGLGNIVTFTENWVHYDSGWSTALFPLKEIEAFQKVCFSMGRGANFYMRLFFRDGGKYKLACQFADLDDIAAVLAARGAQAKRAQDGIF